MECKVRSSMSSMQDFLLFKFSYNIFILYHKKLAIISFMQKKSFINLKLTVGVSWGDKEIDFSSSSTKNDESYEAFFGGI